MDNQQAKFILQAYRPGGQDASDPQIAEALEQARRDPDLGHWLEEELALNRAIGDKLKSVPVPDDLKDSILAGGRIIKPHIWWKQPSLLAAAACIIVLMIITLFSPIPAKQAAAADAEKFATEFLGKLTSLEHVSQNPQELRQWLAKNRGHKEVSLSPGLEQLPALGCCVGDWNGRKVSLICFKVGARGFRDEVHLFVFDRKVVPGLPDAHEPRFSQQGDWVLASWAKGNLSYVLAGLDSKESLKKLL